MVEILLGLMGSVIGVVGGYLFGIVQARNERRDNALADIYGGLSLYYRCLIAWSSVPHMNPLPLPGEPAEEWIDECPRLGKAFNDAYYGNAIWLGEKTDDMINQFARDAQGILERFARMDKNGIILPERVVAKELLRETLEPQYEEIRRVLRAEIETSRYMLPYRLVVKTDEPSQTK